MESPYPYRQPSPGESPPFLQDDFIRKVYFAFMAGLSVKDLAKKHGVPIDDIENGIRCFDLVQTPPWPE